VPIKRCSGVGIWFPFRKTNVRVRTNVPEIKLRTYFYGHAAN
jgi:hypothetical protein